MSNLSKRTKGNKINVLVPKAVTRIHFLCLPKNWYSLVLSPVDCYIALQRWRQVISRGFPQRHESANYFQSGSGCEISVNWGTHRAYHMAKHGGKHDVPLYMSKAEINSPRTDKLGTNTIYHSHFCCWLRLDFSQFIMPPKWGKSSINTLRKLSSPLARHVVLCIPSTYRVYFHLLQLDNIRCVGKVCCISWCIWVFSL